MWLSAVTYLVQGWVAGIGGFSQTNTIAIVLGEVVNAVWMTWLLVVAWRMRPLPSTVLTDTPRCEATSGTDRPE